MNAEEYAELCRTKSRMLADLERDKTPIVEACTKVQVSVKQKADEFDTKVEERRCSRISLKEDGSEFCEACAFPNAKWRLGKCNMATHLYHENRPGKPFTILTPITMDVNTYRKEVQKLNPIKQSKRGG